MRQYSYCCNQYVSHYLSNFVHVTQNMSLRIIIYCYSICIEWTWIIEYDSIKHIFDWKPRPIRMNINTILAIVIIIIIKTGCNVIQCVISFNHDPIKILCCVVFFWLLVCIFIFCKQCLRYVCDAHGCSNFWKTEWSETCVPILSDHIMNDREDPSFQESILKAVRNAVAELKN